MGSDYRVALLCNAYSTNQEYFSKPMAALVQNVLGKNVGIISHFYPYQILFLFKLIVILGSTAATIVLAAKQLADAQFTNSSTVNIILGLSDGSLEDEFDTSHCHAHHQACTVKEQQQQFLLLHGIGSSTRWNLQQTLGLHGNRESGNQRLHKWVYSWHQNIIFQF